MVAHLLPKQRAAGSNPVSRSRVTFYMSYTRLTEILRWAFLIEVTMKIRYRSFLYVLSFGLISLMLLTGMRLYQSGTVFRYLPMVFGGGSIPGPTATTSTTPTTPISNGNKNYKIFVGPGYTDVSPKQIVRTTGNRLYIAASTCDNYPCTDIAQRLRMYQATATGVPVGFKHVDANAEPGGVAGWAIAIDGNNRIHVVWTDRTASGSTINRLRYTTFDTATNTWSGSIETVDAALNVSLDSGGQGVQSVALALDANAVPHVVYLRKGSSDSDRRAYYRNRIGGSWSAALAIDDTISYGSLRAWHPNLAFDTAGRILAVWQRGSFNGNSDGTIFGRVREANGTWGAAVNISGSDASRVIIDQSTSLLITPDNSYHITWLSSPDDYIRYQYSSDLGKSWSFNNPAGGKQVTHNPALGYANGKLRIYGHGTPSFVNGLPDGHGDDLFYFESAGGSASWASWTKIVTGAYDSSINTRWSQYFHAFPNTVDIAYWADPYPNQLYVGSAVLAP